MLKEGRIIEQGTFIQLVKTNGAFSELVRQLEGQQNKVNSICLVRETTTQLSKATSYVTPSVSLGSRKQMGTCMKNYVMSNARPIQTNSPQ